MARDDGRTAVERQGAPSTLSRLERSEYGSNGCVAHLMTAPGTWTLMQKIFPDGPSMVALFAVAAGKRGDCANLRALAPLISAAADARKAAKEGGKGRATKPGSRAKGGRGRLGGSCDPAALA